MTLAFLTLSGFASDHLLKELCIELTSNTHRPQVSYRYRQRFDSLRQLAQVYCTAQFLFSVQHSLVSVCNIMLYWMSKKLSRNFVKDRISSIMWNHCFCVQAFSNPLKWKKYCYFGRILWERSLKLFPPPPTNFPL